MIFQAFETLVSVEESMSTVRPEWHAPGSLQSSFEVDSIRLIEILNRHWTPISHISQFWYEAVSARRHKFPTTIKSSHHPPQAQLNLARRKHRKITKVSAEVDGDEIFSHIGRLNAHHPLESITLYQVVQGIQRLKSWDSLSQVKHLRELRIHQPLSIPLSSVLKVLNSSLELKVLKIYSFEEIAWSDPSNLPITSLQGADKERSRKTLEHLTCHYSQLWHPNRSCNSLVTLLTTGGFSLKILTLVFEKINSTAEQGRNSGNENLLVGVQDSSAVGLLAAFGSCQDLKTLQVSAPDEMFSLPFIDPIINTLQHLENLHLKGNLFSPLLFVANVLPKTLKKIECQAYSSPILPLLSAARHSLTHLTNLQALTITTYRRKPRNFTEAIYGQLDLPIPAEEVTTEEPLSWDLTPTETLEQQQLLIHECQLRSIKLDGPRAYVPPFLEG